MKRIINYIAVVFLTLFVYNTFAYALVGDLNEDGVVNHRDTECFQDYEQLKSSEYSGKAINTYVDFIPNLIEKCTASSEESEKIKTKVIVAMASGGLGAEKYVSEWLDLYNRLAKSADLNNDGRVTQVGDLNIMLDLEKYGHSYCGELEATSCAGFRCKGECNVGIGKDQARFGCAWNEKYEFCSPNGLAYLSCGSGDTAAHDIPVFIPRITSYGITILKTVTPVILIIMSMIQIIKAIASQNEDEMKKAKSALIKKLVAAVMIFFIITIVQFVIKQAADSSELGSANQCLSCFVNNDCNGSMYYVDGYGHCYYLSDKYKAVDCKTDIGIKEDNQQGGATNSSSNSNSNSNSSSSSNSNSNSNSSSSSNSNSSSSGGSAHGGGENSSGAF